MMVTLLVALMVVVKAVKLVANWEYVKVEKWVAWKVVELVEWLATVWVVSLV